MADLAARLDNAKPVGEFGGPKVHRLGDGLPRAFTVVGVQEREPGIVGLGERGRGHAVDFVHALIPEEFAGGLIQSHTP